MISVFEKPDTPHQAVLAVLCTWVAGVCFGAYIDRALPFRIPTRAYGFVTLLAWLVSWLRRYFV